MQIIIDGYNLIKQLFNVSKVSEKKRDSYIQQLISRAKAKSHTLVIVFDGGSYGFPTQEYLNGNLIIYSGYKESADDVIKKYVSDNRHLDLLVVTSDREIRNFVHNLGIETLDSLSFDKLFSQETTAESQKLRMTSNARVTKISTDKNKKLDELMKQVTDVMDKVDEPKVFRESRAHKQSKKEKKKQKKLSKL